LEDKSELDNDKVYYLYFKETEDRPSSPSIADDSKRVSFLRLTWLYLKFTIDNRTGAMPEVPLQIQDLYPGSILVQVYFKELACNLVS
jgi:hypothetical protein